MRDSEFAAVHQNSANVDPYYDEIPDDLDAQPTALLPGREGVRR
jgi:hypothetical protein